MKNLYPEQHDTHQRQTGGNTAPTGGEAHGQPKAKRIPAERRFDGAETTTDLSNSPGRVSSDVRDRE